MRVVHDVLAHSQEGIELHTEVWRPQRGGRVPSLLLRTPYGSTDAQQGLYPHPSALAEHGYAVVVQDVRGRGRSEGVFQPFRHEAADGAAAVDWVARQPWCDGKVGMYGMSYPGAAQLLAATRGPVPLRAIAPAMTASDLWSGWFYEHGVLNLSLVPFWAAVLAVDAARRAGDVSALGQLRALCARPEEIYDRHDTVAPGALLGDAGGTHAPFLQRWLEHRTRDGFWESAAMALPPEQIRVPGLHIAGWFDVLLGGTLATYRRLSDLGAAPQHLVIGPWAHEPWSAIVGDRDLGEAAGNRVGELQLRWFDHWLRGARLELAPISVFVLGSNRWREEETWPPRDVAVTRLYLRSRSGANSLSGDGQLTLQQPAEESHDRFLHDPRRPVATLGGRGCSITNGTIVGPRDQRPQEARNDVLVYESAPVSRSALIAGEVRAELYVSRPEHSADYVLRLVHVAADGSTFGVTDAVARITAAATTTSPTAEVETVTPAVLSLRMTLGHCCLALAPGERVRLDVCGSSYPRWERNWNGQPPVLRPLALTEACGLQHVFHEPGLPSAILLPFIDRPPL